MTRPSPFGGEPRPAHSRAVWLLPREYKSGKYLPQQSAAMPSTRSGRKPPTSSGDLWRSDGAVWSTVLRSGPKVELTTVVTWQPDERHDLHLTTIERFLRNGTFGINPENGFDVTYGAPCGDGIGASYIKYVMKKNRPLLTCAISVWARVNDSEPIIVNGLVCKDLLSGPGISDRLYLWMVCGKFPGAFSLAMRTLKEEARAKEQVRLDGSSGPRYAGISLTASRLSLIPVYQRQGFDVTPNACTYPVPGQDLKRGSREKLYEDRVKTYTCNQEGIDCGESSKWATQLVHIGLHVSGPDFGGTGLDKPYRELSPEEKQRRAKAEQDFWKATKAGIAGTDWPDDDDIVPGDGIFMDLCFGRREPADFVATPPKNMSGTRKRTAES